MSRINAAMQQIMEDTGWREDLTDSEAESLIAWAQKRLTDIDAAAVGDVDFDIQAAKIRSLLPQINRFVGRRSSMTAEEQQALLDKLAENNSLNRATPAQITTLAAKEQAKHASPADQFRALAAQVDPSLKADTSNDQMPVLTALTAWIDGASLPEADPMLAQTFSAQAAPPVEVMGSDAATEPAPPPDPASTDPAAASIFDFFNTAPPEPPVSDSPDQKPADDSHNA